MAPPDRRIRADQPPQFEINRIDHIGQIDHIEHITGMGNADKPHGAKRGGRGAQPEREVPVEEAAALGPPKHVDMTVVAQDPSVRSPSGRILTATVRVAADRIRPPLRTHRFDVISFNPESGRVGRGIRLLDVRGRFRDRFARARNATLLHNTDFHAQNVLAIASRTLAAFEGALGRRVPWGFDSHQLYLIPRAMIEANAYYAPDKHALLFGVVPGPTRDKTTYTCLSHDIIAHETTHAILAGLRPSFDEAGLPDQLAFHEALADIVAILSVFAVPAVAEHALGSIDTKGRIEAKRASVASLRRSVLFGLAEEVGSLIHGVRGRPLRDSVNLSRGAAWKKDPAFRLPHRRAEVLVAAVTHALLEIWSGRLKDITSVEGLSRRRAAEEGAKSAEHLLRMCIRAIDYCPPLEFEFADFLDAILVADQQIAPDDEHQYRPALVRSFRRFGIERPDQHIVPVESLSQRPIYERFNFAALRTDPDEVFRFIWENDELLDLDLDYHARVESIWPATRVGPDGFVVNEVVVAYRQVLDARAGELVNLSKTQRARRHPAKKPLRLPEDLPRTTEVRILGGGAIIFDQFGRPKFHQTKPLLDWTRQSDRIAHLWETNYGADRLGFSSRSDSQVRLSQMHRTDEQELERW